MQKPLFTGCRVLVLGDIILDRYIEGGISRISPEAPVPVLKKTGSYCRLGGAGNVAANLAGIGAECSLLSACGEDALRFELQELLRRTEIDFFLFEDPSRATVSKTRVLSGQHHLLRIDEEQTHAISAAGEELLLERLEERLPRCGAVIVSDYGKGICSPALCQSAIAMAQAYEVPVFVDPKGTAWSKYSGAACVTPNLSEFSAVAGSGVETASGRMAAARGLCRDLGLERMLITMGINGMLLVGPAGETETVAARAKQVFDVSGAGDTVVSLLAACRAAAMDWRSAMETASLAAGIVVGKVGTQPVLIREIHDEIRRERDGHFAKIHTVEEAVEKVSLWRAEGDTIVFTNGCFDLLHPGHVHLLNQAASLGSKLVVGLNSDDSVSRLKGPGRPVLGQADRSALLASLQDVDMVIVFDADTPIALIEALGPDVLVKGGDYSRETVVGADLVEARGGRVMLVSLKEGIGTSRIIERIHSSGN
jgi:D-beta-D-heptose 7-phosphate kinase/D-beta-D-heptose 1-phosphate adenosyltransferase